MSKPKSVTVDDPDNYEALSLPFESADAANAEIVAFWEDVRLARQKHKLADVHIIVYTSFKAGSEVKHAATFGHYGNGALAMVMCADSIAEEAKSWRKFLFAQPPDGSET